MTRKPKSTAIQSSVIHRRVGVLATVRLLADDAAGAVV